MVVRIILKLSLYQNKTNKKRSGLSTAPIRAWKGNGLRHFHFRLSRNAHLNRFTLEGDALGQVIQSEAA